MDMKQKRKMMRKKNSLNRKLSKDRLLKVSIETIELAMLRFILKLPVDDMSNEQIKDLKTIFQNFIKIQESK